jgi:NADPH-dependent glutamate synthase beta subunit-like oxidoreductase
MTAMREEVAGAIEEGCEVLELQAPVKIEKDENGKAIALWVQPQIIGSYDRGRPKPNNAKTDLIRLSCDKILVAIGQGIESREFEKFGIPVKRGVIDALNWSGIKDIDGVFAGGDCVTGPATVIRAIAAGKVAAANIDEYLGYRHELTTDINIPPIRLDDRCPCGRVNMRERTADERKQDFKLMECGMSEEEALQESRRCLRCDHFGYGILKGGRVEKW